MLRFSNKIGHILFLKIGILLMKRIEMEHKRYCSPSTQMNPSSEWQKWAAPPDSCRIPLLAAGSLPIATSPLCSRSPSLLLPHHLRWGAAPFFFAADAAAAAAEIAALAGRKCWQRNRNVPRLAAPVNGVEVDRGQRSGHPQGLGLVPG